MRLRRNQRQLQVQQEQVQQEHFIESDSDTEVMATSPTFPFTKITTENSSQVINAILTKLEGLEINLALDCETYKRVTGPLFTLVEYNALRARQFRILVTPTAINSSYRNLLCVAAMYIILGREGSSIYLRIWDIVFI